MMLMGNMFLRLLFEASCGRPRVKFSSIANLVIGINKPLRLGVTPQYDYDH